MRLHLGDGPTSCSPKDQAASDFEILPATKQECVSIRRTSRSPISTHPYTAGSSCQKDRATF